MSERAESGGSAFWGDVDDSEALQRYRALVDAVDEGVYRLDGDGRFVAVNDAFLEMTGYAREDLLGDHVSRILDGSEAARNGEAADVFEAPIGQDGDSIALGLVSPDGERFYSEHRPIRDPNAAGAGEGVAYVVHSLEPRPRNGDGSVTLPNEQTLADVLDEADGVGVFVLDADLEVAWIDDTIERYFGIDRAEVVGRDKRDLFEETIRSRVANPEEFAETVLATYDDDETSLEQFECHVTAGENREERWLEHRSNPIRSGQYEGGRIELYYDITDRKRSQDTLEETEEQFQTLVDAVEEYAIFRLDPDGDVISWNRGAKRIKGYDTEEILGEHFSTFYTDEDRAAGIPERNLQAATETGSTEDEGWRLRKNGTRFWANVTITAIRGDDGSHNGYLKVTRDMTDRYEHEQELESRLQRIFDRISDGFFALDEDYRFTHVNERAEGILAVDAEALLGSKIWSALPEIRNTAFEERYREAMATQESLAFEEYYPPNDAWYEVHAYPSESGLSVYVRDVTERREREQELQRTERRFKAIFEDPNILVGLLDPDGTVLDINRTAMEYIDADLADVTGEPFWETPWWGEGDGVRDAVEEWTERAAAGEYVDFEADLTRPDGERYTLSGYFRPVTNDDGEVVSIIVSDRDVTERKRHERELAESEQRYRTLVENFPNGAVALVDEEIRYRTVGGRPQDIAEIEAENLEGKKVKEAIPPKLADELVPAYEAAFDGETSQFEIEFRGNIYQFYVVPVRDDGVFAALGMSQDITEREEAKRKLEESNERLEQFAYAASHDLQEPLRMISSYLQLLERRYGEELDGDGEEFIEFAVDGADRMKTMIEGLLEYSRVETRGNPLEATDLGTVLEDVRTDLQFRIEESDAAITAEELPRVAGDPDQLRQVFQNLLENAIEYSGDDPPRIRVSATRAGDRWEVAVADEGIGIAPEDQERIFEVFQRLHSREEHSGTGIGLALCERIVERHGGDIWVESEPGEGTTFRFTLRATSGQNDDGN